MIITPPRICLAVLFMCFMSGTALALTLDVGEFGYSYTSIQTAIDNAFSGRDTVLVHDGVYNENIDFNGKTVVVRSENGPASTIIDGGKNGSVVVFNSEGPGSVLDGFTVRNGSANSSTDFHGGGIYLGSAFPRIKNCTIEDNRAGFGGGIYSIKFSPSFENCTIRNNIATDSGGGIYCDSSSPIIKNCVITGNKSIKKGGKGGAISCFNSRFIMTNSQVSENEATMGAGIHCDLSSPTISSSKIFKNTAIFPGGAFVDQAFGGGISCESSSPTLTNCLIYRNSATHNGGGVYCTTNSLITITNCTISGNTAGAWNGGGGIYLYWDGSSTVNLLNSIVWGNGVVGTPNEVVVELLFPPFINDEFVNARYSLVRNGISASYLGERASNINVDPKFVNTSDGTENYNIQSDSPAIDAGDPTGALPDFPENDIDGVLRSAVSDIGAYEYCSIRNTYYRDSDRDGYGDVNAPITVCSAEPPPGYTANNSDCNDKTSLIHPGAEEICNFWDDNCDGLVNEGLGSAIYYHDADGDSFGSSREPMAVCSGDTVQAGYVSNEQDCDDTNNGVHPGAAEACNRLDDNCSGDIDEGFNTTTYYQDADNDGFGNDEVSQTLCEEEAVPSGYIANNGDCNDTNAAVNPDTRWYFDRDKDGFGSPSLNTSIQQCVEPIVLHLDYVMNDRDCNDRNPNQSTGSLWHKDVDDDGYSDGVTMEACTKPLNYKTEAQLLGPTYDCDDTDASINPDTTDVLTWYKDADNDGYSDGVTMSVCSAPTGYKLEKNLLGILGDCDDTDPTVTPQTSTLTTWYLDEDNDGYSTGETVDGCFKPIDYSSESSLVSTTDFDCDDKNPVLNPATVWYRDVDGDKFSDGFVSIGCTRPANHALPSELLALEGDTDDNNIDVKPTNIAWYRDEDQDGYSTGLPGDVITQENRPNNGVRYADRTELEAVTGDCNDTEYNINPGTVWYRDADNDGYSNGETLTQCDTPTGYKQKFDLTAMSGDINDDNAAVYPGSSTGSGGSGNTGGVKWYKDADNDGYSTGDYVSDSTPPDVSYKHYAGMKQVYGDCNDNDPTIYPGAHETCEDGVDKNCDTKVIACATTISVSKVTDPHDITRPLFIIADIAKSSGDSVYLYYSPEKSNSFKTIIMKHSGGEAWEAIIEPKDLPIGDNLRFFVTIVDAQNLFVGEPFYGKIPIQGAPLMGEPSEPGINNPGGVPTVNEWGLLFLALLFLRCFYLREASPTWQK